MEGDFIKKECCGEIFGHKTTCKNYVDMERMRREARAEARQNQSFQTVSDSVT